MKTLLAKMTPAGEEIGCRGRMRTVFGATHLCTMIHKGKFSEFHTPEIGESRRREIPVISGPLSIKKVDDKFHIYRHDNGIAIEDTDADRTLIVWTHNNGDPIENRSHNSWDRILNVLAAYVIEDRVDENATRDRCVRAVVDVVKSHLEQYTSENAVLEAC